MKTVFIILIIWAILYCIASNLAKFYDKQEKIKNSKFIEDINNKLYKNPDITRYNDTLILAIQQKLILRYIMFGANNNVIIFLDKKKQSPLFKILTADTKKFKRLPNKYLVELSKFRSQHPTNNMNNIKKYPELGPVIYNWADTVDNENTEDFKDFTNHNECIYLIKEKDLKTLINLIKLYL